MKMLKEKVRLAQSRKQTEQEAGNERERGEVEGNTEWKGAEKEGYEGWKGGEVEGNTEWKGAEKEGYEGWKGGEMEGNTEWKGAEKEGYEGWRGQEKEGNKGWRGGEKDMRGREERRKETMDEEEARGDAKIRGVERRGARRKETWDGEEGRDKDMRGGEWEGKRIRGLMNETRRLGVGGRKVYGAEECEMGRRELEWSAKRRCTIEANHLEWKEMEGGDDMMRDGVEKMGV
ncbi:hypothetical protein Pcinc_027235 [Petrolisthes cinctipes]|uniref:Uncharacterized protein n=1 Tax=Petrolisthes cinctipes TaxID=88211 RepID=A0AAE1F4S5_PETCI|nr:hypothetical protein Pcinc_027235 [Petrolisthes cinctipes]